MRFLLAFFCLFSGFSFADLPDNNLHLEDNADFYTNVSQDDFENAIKDLQDIYGPIAKNLGYNLVIDGDWEDSTVNAYTYRRGKTWYIKMFGGLARRQEITLDGFKLVICHELGHQMGGYPMSGWASFEGQSDYVGSFVCGKKVFSKPQSQQQIDIPEKYEYCESYLDDGDRAICNRNLGAGYSLALLLATLSGYPEPTYETPDLSVVDKTQKMHPKAQCRLDTYLAGSLCDKSWDDGIIPKKDGYVCDTRPRCWFKS